GWAKRRVSSTTTVLVILSEVTTPWRVFRRARPSVFGSVISSLVRGAASAAQLPGPQDRLDPRDIPPEAAKPHRVLDRLGGGPEPEPELLLGQLRQLGAEVLDRQLGEFSRLHRS